MEQKDLMIGSDPELSFETKDGDFIAADELLPDSTSQEIGVDGNSNIGELRPKAHPCPLAHLKEIEKLLEKVAKMVGTEDDIRVVAGCGSKYPLGGHIHFSMPPDPHFIQILDMMAIYLSQFENVEWGIRRRTGSGYGQLGAIEKKRYGFEYRTLGSFLGNRLYAAATLSIGYVLAWEWLNDWKHLLKMEKTFLRNFSDRKQVCTEFNAHRLRYFQTKQFDFFAYFEKNVRRCILFKKYHGFISSLFGLRRVGKLSKEDDLLGNWKFVVAKQYLFSFTGDEGLAQLAPSVGNTESQLNIKVFGIKHERGVRLIWASNKVLADILNQIVKQHNIHCIIERTTPYRQHSVGFSYDVRTTKPEQIITILNSLAELQRRGILTKESMDTASQESVPTQRKEEEEEPETDGPEMDIYEDDEGEEQNDGESQ